MSAISSHLFVSSNFRIFFFILEMIKLLAVLQNGSEIKKIIIIYLLVKFLFYGNNKILVITSRNIDIRKY